MLLFRSEEHVERWLAVRGLPPGATFPLEQGWRLADAWYGDRMSPSWRPRTGAEAQAVLDSVGLSGSFWRLPD
jgi:hypothetical protein